MKLITQEIADNINILGSFLGRRDIALLNENALFEKCGTYTADVMVLFGGSILAGGDLMAEAIKSGLAARYVIVGGEGHTTEALRERVHQEYPQIETAGLPEAEVFRRYLHTVYDCEVDYIETESTNCGNNITNLLALLQEHGIKFKCIILMQDATMQARMDAGMRKYAPDDCFIINYASYAAHVVCTDGELDYSERIHGMWPVERYVNLLMGEIPRLCDDENGYGPNGKNFIAHVDIPEDVLAAYKALNNALGTITRTADPRWATK